MKIATRMLAVALTMAPLLAAAQMGPNDKVVTNVPFEFVVGKTIVPAGKCTVQLTRAGTGLAIQNAKVGLYSSMVLDESKKPSGEYALIFHRYGDRTFLSGIKTANSTLIYRLPVSKAEAELHARNAPSIEETLLASAK